VKEREQDPLDTWNASLTSVAAVTTVLLYIFNLRGAVRPWHVALAAAAAAAAATDGMVLIFSIKCSSNEQ